jgi:hypothetical protein
VEDICKSLTLATKKVKKETDARRQVEKMLWQYKEEVDVLNKALQLAAMDAISQRSDVDALLSPGLKEEGLKCPHVDEIAQQHPSAEHCRR